MKFNCLKKTFFLVLIGIAGASISVNAAHGDKVVTSEPFEGKVVTDGLEFPWEMVWGQINSFGLQSVQEGIYVE